MTSFLIGLLGVTVPMAIGLVLFGPVGQVAGLGIGIVLVIVIMWLYVGPPWKPRVR